MFIRWFPILFFLTVSLASCSTPPHWITREELQPAPDPNIEKIELVDGPLVEFNHALGWYDAEKSTIEGVTITGWHDTIYLARVQRVELAGENNTVGEVILSFAFLMVGMLIAFFIWVGKTGGL